MENIYISCITWLPLVAPHTLKLEDFMESKIFGAAKANAQETQVHSLAV